jgi:hypothetical protein
VFSLMFNRFDTPESKRERRKNDWGNGGECKTLTNMSRKQRISFQSSQVGINQRPNKLENARLNLLLITIEIIER